MVGPLPPLSFQKRAAVAEVSFHNNIIAVPSPRGGFGGLSPPKFKYETL